MGRAATAITWRMLLLACAVVTCTGCPSSTEEAIREEDSATGKMRRYENQFVPSAEDQPAATQGREPSADSVKREDGTAARAETPAATTEVPGFRIQVFSTNNFDEAEGKKSEAQLIFKDEWVYLQYDQPTYKIRVGNFLTRFEAERFRNLAIEKGFAEAWIVPERVFKNPPPPPQGN